GLLRRRLLGGLLRRYRDRLRAVNGRHCLGTVRGSRGLGTCISCLGGSISLRGTVGLRAAGGGLRPAIASLGGTIRLHGTFRLYGSIGGCRRGLRGLLGGLRRRCGGGRFRAVLCVWRRDGLELALGGLRRLRLGGGILGGRGGGRCFDRRGAR